MRKRCMVALLAVVCLLGGCGGTMSNSAADHAAPMEEAAYSADVAADYEAGEIAEAPFDDAETDSASDDGGQASRGADAADIPKTDQKLIVTENLSVETTEFKSLLDTVNKKVSQLGGYIESSQISGKPEYEDQYADFRIRIPADKLGDFVTTVEEHATVTYDGKTTEDVTLQYVDTESHLNALRTEEEALVRLLEQAKKLSDVFDIQERLTQVRYEIESYASQLRVYDNKVDYSTVNLTVQEVARETAPAEKGFWSEAMAELSNTLYVLGRTLRSFGIWLIGSFPVLAIIAVVVILSAFFLRRRVRNVNQKKSDTSKETHDGE